MGSVGKPMGSMREALGSVFFIMFNFSFGIIGTIWVPLGQAFFLTEILEAN